MRRDRENSNKRPPYLYIGNFIAMKRADSILLWILNCVCTVVMPRVEWGLFGWIGKWYTQIKPTYNN
jgi:hypothetical protein